MAEENKPEMTPKQDPQRTNQLKGALANLVQATSSIERELAAADRHEAREEKRVALLEREANQHAEHVAVIKTHCARMEEIAQENSKHMASIAVSLHTIVKAAAESV